MADNKIEDAKQKVEQTQESIKETAKLAESIASGNFLAAAKSALKLMKNGEFKKRIRKRLIMMAIRIFIPIALAACLFAGINKIKNEMINLMSSISTSVSSFLKRTWKRFTDDFWIYLDEETKYVVNVKTGEVLDILEDGEEEKTYKDELGNIIETKIEEDTIVDRYIKQLGDQGLSLKELRLLGDADYSDEEKLLEDEKNKALVEKYISEFIRADIITQETHKRRGEELVDENNQNKVDGGVYLTRIKEDETELQLDLFDKEFTEEEGYAYNDETGMFSKLEEIDTENTKYKEMTYITPEEFLAKFDLEGNTIPIGTKLYCEYGKGEKIVKDLRYNYSIDVETGKLILFEYSVDTVIIKKDPEVVTENVGNDDTSRNEWMDKYEWLNEAKEEWKDANDDGLSLYSITPIAIDYKDLISKYTMPYEFLINLCEVTQNPEFVYHVALLARDTKIVLGVYDETTRTTRVEAQLIDTSYYRNDTNQTRVDPPTDRTMYKHRKKIHTSSTVIPVIRIEFADTWSYYDEFKYLREISGKAETEGPTDAGIELGNTLTKYKEPEFEVNNLGDGKTEVKVKTPGYWYDTFNRRVIDYKREVQLNITYPEEPKIVVHNIEKSKQFLGLLRNNDGTCHYDCDVDLEIVEENGKSIVKKDPVAIKCAENAEFDKNGINVKYRIPNTTEMQAPYNKLTSGIEMLYAVLQSNANGYIPNEDGTGQQNQNINKSSTYNANKDNESNYIGKMQGLVEHLKYLMTLPENETYEVKKMDIEDWEDPTNEEEKQEQKDIIYEEGFWWPTEPEGTITSKFGYRKQPKKGASTYHKGIDIGVPVGTRVIASNGGVVEEVGYNSTSGNFIKITHENGFKTSYCHLSSILVKVGDVVNRGDLIAYSGNTGVSTGPHLHFAIILNGTYVDPLNYVSQSNPKPNKFDKLFPKFPNGPEITKGNKTYPTDTNSEQFDIMCAIVQAEGGSSYESALAVITCALNRINNTQWYNYGKTPYEQLTKPDQFVVYQNGSYEKYLNKNSKDFVQQAVNDALNNGYRNHNCTSFRTTSDLVKLSHPEGFDIGGNWYF